jgi:hypothetical protein
LRNATGTFLIRNFIDLVHLQFLSLYISQIFKADQIIMSFPAERKMISFDKTPFANVIRVTPDKLYASALDIITAVKNTKFARQQWKLYYRKLLELESEYGMKLLFCFQFVGQGQRLTPTLSFEGIQQLLMLISQKKVRAFCAKGFPYLQHFLPMISTVLSSSSFSSIRRKTGPDGLINNGLPVAGESSVTTTISLYNTPFAGKIVRITPNKRYVSAIDLIRAISENKNPGDVWRKCRQQIENINIDDLTADSSRLDNSRPMISSYHFPGERETPTLTAYGVIQLLWVIPGKKACAFRKYCGALVIRALGGDESLIREISINHKNSLDDTTHHSFFAAAIAESANVQCPFQTAENSEGPLTALEQREKELVLEHEYSCRRDERERANTLWKYEQEKSNALWKNEEEIALISRKNEEEIALLSRKSKIQLSFISQHNELTLISRLKHDRVDLLGIEDMKHDVSPLPKRKNRMPQFAIFLKSKPDHSDSSSNLKVAQNALDYYAVRCQAKTMPRALAILKEDRYPNSSIVINPFYNPNPVAFFSRLQEDCPIRRIGNHFSILGNHTREQEIALIKKMLDNESAFTVLPKLQELDKLANSLILANPKNKSMGQITV